MQRDEVVIQDIINAAKLVIEFVQESDQENFISDWKTSTVDVPDLLAKIDSF